MRNKTSDATVSNLIDVICVDTTCMSLYIIVFSVVFNRNKTRELNISVSVHRLFYTEALDLRAVLNIVIFHK